MTYEERWAKTEFVVEASHEEMFQIWKEWHKEVGFEQCSGWSHEICSLYVVNPIEQLGIGILKDPFHKATGPAGKSMPLVVSISWQLIDGHLVAFYYACSILVHHGLVREYIDSMTPNGVKHTNASNFSHVIVGLKIVARERPPL